MTAVFAGTAVLAESPNCVIDGVQVTDQQLADNPELCASVPPVPPVPPVVEEEEPVAPVEPVVEETPTEEPVTEEPVVDDPVVEAPVVEAPATEQLEVAEPAVDESVEQLASPPALETTTDVATPPAPEPELRSTEPEEVTADDLPPLPAKPAKESKPEKSKPAKKETKSHKIIKAKLFNVPFQDARTFRQKLTLKNRIPEQPRLDVEHAAAFKQVANSSNSDFGTLAALAWIESRWGDPSAGAVLGRRLSNSQWSAYGKDGDSNGKVERTSVADQAATVVNFFASARATKQQSQSAYFTNAKSQVMVERLALLAAYFNALGEKALTEGINSPQTRDDLIDRVLNDKRVTIYDGGRGDIKAGYVDPRVISTILFLANRFDEVTISSIISGHGVYTASGNISLHAYGQAVDVATLGNEVITASSQQGKDSRTARAVRDILTLPNSIQPKELISLWDMGGASFAASDHGDHIHIGFDAKGNHKH